MLLERGDADGVEGASADAIAKTVQGGGRELRTRRRKRQRPQDRQLTPGDTTAGFVLVVETFPTRRSHHGGTLDFHPSLRYGREARSSLRVSMVKLLRTRVTEHSRHGRAGLLSIDSLRCQRKLSRGIERRPS
jgi:hypothetical protein